MAEACGSGHLGGSFSIMDALVALEFEIMDKNDVLVYSKAHCCEALYAVLCEKGVIKKEELKSFGEWGSRLQGHSEHWALPNVYYSGGSLGQGLSFACGVALAKKLKGERGRVFCIIGDGECHEGQIWESAMFASQYELSNLVVIIDHNMYTGDTKPIRCVVSVTPLNRRWALFGWDDYTASGHDMERLKDIFMLGSVFKYKPIVFILHTVKGKGVDVWEESHSHLQYGKELEEGIKEWRKNGVKASV